MKKVISLVLVSMFLSVVISYAELYVIADKKTNEIFTASEKNDTVYDTKTQELIVLPGGWENYEFADAPTNHKLKNKKFSLNIDKVNKQEEEKVKAKEKADEEEIIKEEMRKSAIEQLKVEGVKFKYN